MNMKSDEVKTLHGHLTGTDPTNPGSWEKLWMETLAGIIEITPRDLPALKTSIPIAVKLHRDKGGWIGWLGENAAFGIRVAVSSTTFKRWKWYNIRELKKAIIEHIDFTIDQYLVEGGPNISAGLQAIIERWKPVVDLGKFRHVHLWEAVEPDAEGFTHHECRTSEQLAPKEKKENDT